MSDREVDYIGPFFDDEDEPACQSCGGEGIEECEDVNSSEGCWAAHCNGSFHECTNCHGSGQAKDQTYW